MEKLIVASGEVVYRTVLVGFLDRCVVVADVSAEVFNDHLFLLGV